MRCLFIGGPAAGQVLTVKEGVSWVSFPIPAPGGYGEFRYCLRKIKDDTGNMHTVCTAGDPLVELMKFYELHAKGESQ